MSNNENVKPGEKAEDFTLKNQYEKEVSLSDFEGKKVLLSFHPLAWTEVCRNQMESLEENYENFEEKNTVPLGISVDPVPTKKAWSKDMELEKTQILADFWPHGKIAKKYGIFREENGFSERANILINKKREIEFIKVHDIHKVPNIKEILEKI